MNRPFCLTIAFFSFTLLILFPHFSFGIKPTDTVENNTNHTYAKNIRSIELHKTGFVLSEPVINLQSGESISVAFDDLQLGVKHFFYTVYHCTSNWERSEIWVNEYLENYTEDKIEEYQPSFNTRTPYMHYSFSFPNDRFIITKSGNYILKAYEKDDNGNEVLQFTRRIYVVDSKVSITANANIAASAEGFESKQEVDFSILNAGRPFVSPYQDIKVAVLQNWRWDNAITNLKPQMVRNNMLDYNYDNESNWFDGGNEFRYINIKSIRTAFGNVKEISYNDTLYLVRLMESQRRVFKNYISDEDINGKFLLKSDDESDVATMGEYVKVYLFLSMEAPAIEGDIYVCGGFNGWEYNSENKMRYNYRRKGYELSLLLKQGYYDYQYVMLPVQSTIGDVTWIEGNHSATINTYTILVYHREKGSLYDELIGIHEFTSGNKK